MICGKGDSLAISSDASALYNRAIKGPFHLSKLCVNNIARLAAKSITTPNIPPHDGEHRLHAHFSTPAR